MISAGRGFVLCEKLQKGFCPPYKKEMGGGEEGNISTLQKQHGRDYVHLHKNGQGGFRLGGILSGSQYG